MIGDVAVQSGVVHLVTNGLEFKKLRESMASFSSPEKGVS